MTTFILLPLASAMKTLIAVIIVIITTSQAIKAEHHEEHSQQQHKKEHLGFFVSSAKFKPSLLFYSSCSFVNVSQRAREADEVSTQIHQQPSNLMKETKQTWENWRTWGTPLWVCRGMCELRKDSSACEARRTSIFRRRRNELCWEFNRFVQRSEDWVVLSQKLSARKYKRILMVFLNMTSFINDIIAE